MTKNNRADLCENSKENNNPMTKDNRADLC